MRLDLRILGLPASVLFLLASHMIPATAAQDDETAKQWELPIQKRWPPDSPQRRRQVEAVEEHLRLGRSPVGVLKMSSDAGEKFYMDYWQFEEGLEQSQQRDIGASLRARDEEEEARLLANASAVLSFRPPFALHTEEGVDPLGFEDLRARKAVEGRNSAAVLAMLSKRGFQCPTGTADCSGIGASNLCCPTTEFCYSITDNGLGSVGCCPNGSSCGGTISPCSSPNTACAASQGPGCCIPNYICAGIGCVINPSLVVTTVITQTFTVSESSTGKTTETTTVVTTLTSTTTSPTTSSTTSSTTTPSASSTLASSTTTVAGSPPVRQTSDPSTTTQLTQTSCPVGFYGCSATHAGGCCQTGRNCDTTNCPATESTTIVSSGKTIVVPVGPAATVTTPTGNCASGWATCDASVGGNCCPSSWSCGTASCSSPGASSTAFVQKESPNGGVASKGVGACGAVMIAFTLSLLLI